MVHPADVMADQTETKGKKEKGHTTSKIQEMSKGEGGILTDPRLQYLVWSVVDLVSGPRTPASDSLLIER